MRYVALLSTFTYIEIANTDHMSRFCYAR